MRERVTITLDPAVTLRAKQIAQSKGISLSRMVEELLREHTGGKPRQTQAKEKFSSRWRGTFKLKTGPEPRRQYLMNKYGLGEDINK